MKILDQQVLKTQVLIRGLLLYSGSPLEVVHIFRLEYSDRNPANLDVRLENGPTSRDKVVTPFGPCLPSYPNISIAIEGIR